MSDFQRFFILENVGKIKNVKKRDTNKKRFFYIYGFFSRHSVHGYRRRSITSTLHEARSNSIRREENALVSTLLYMVYSHISPLLT